MKKIGIFLVGFILTACTPREIVIDKPDDVIPQDSFTNLLIDLVVLEAHIQGKYVQLNNYNQIMVDSGDSLLKLHGITHERFLSTMMYYGQLPQTIDSIYTTVIDTLNIRLAGLPEVD